MCAVYIRIVDLLYFTIFVIFSFEKKRTINETEFYTQHTIESETEWRPSVKRYWDDKTEKIEAKSYRKKDCDD